MLNLLGIYLKREEAILVLKELFEKCTNLDGHYLELLPPNASSRMSGGYQIQIKANLDEETRTCMQDVLMKNHLTIKITDPDSFIIYRPTGKHKES
jgi:hypothetical protein